MSTTKGRDIFRQVLTSNAPAENVVSMAGEAVQTPSGAVVVQTPVQFRRGVNADAFPDCSPPKMWVDGGLVQERFLTMISGPSKAHKSFLLQDLAVAIAGGGGWIGRDCQEKGRVLLVDLEIDDHYLFSRINRIRNDSGKAGESIADRLMVLPWRHETIQEGASTSKVFDAIIAEAEEHRADVVLIDSVYLLLEGDESDPVAVELLLKQMLRLCKKGRAVVFTHHFAKGSAQAQAAKSAIDRGSGSSWWSRFCDVLIPLTPAVLDDEFKEREIFIVEPTLRHHVRISPFAIEWTEGPRFKLLTEAQAASVTQAVQAETKHERSQIKKVNETAPKIYRVLKLLCKDGKSVPQPEWKKECVNSDGISHGTFHRAADWLVKEGKVERDETSRPFLCRTVVEEPEENADNAPGLL
jgi:archaellum biogenesis ATPase FlaH